MKEMVGGCCVCSEELGWTENPLVYCDGQGCNVAVHQACYGIIQVPSGPWFCRKCESQERAARVKCELCPQREGALKRTDSGGWCHVVCALYIPEAWFGNVQTMEPIILKGLPPERFNKVMEGHWLQCRNCGLRVSYDLSHLRTHWKDCRISLGKSEICLTCGTTYYVKLGGKRRNRQETGSQDNGTLGRSIGISCYICDENGHAARGNTGCCMKCNKKSCKQYFHVTCAQGQGLLCEEQGNYQDNVKYCGYCSYHYKKLVNKKDSHIKIIPAFKPVATMEPSTPDNTPEKSSQPQVRMDRSKVKDGKMKNPTVSLETITAFNTSSAGSSNHNSTSTTSSAPVSTSAPSLVTVSASSFNATTSSGTSGPSTPSGGTLGKFTTANFTETTITPSPANLGELLTGAGDKSSSPAAQDKPAEKSNNNNNRRKPVLGSRTPPQSRTPPRTPPQNRSKTPPATTSAPLRTSESGASLSSSTSSYGSTSSQQKESKKSLALDHPLGISIEKQRERTTSMCSNSSVGSSTSTVSASSETHIQNGAIVPNGDDAKPKKAVGSSASSNTTSAPNTSASPSSFNYSFENYVKSNYPGAQMSPSKQDDMPVLSVAQSGTEQVAKRPRSRSTDKIDKRKGKRQKMGTAVPAAGSGGNGSKARTVKDFLESGPGDSTAATGNVDVEMKPDVTRRPGPAKRKKQDSFSLAASLPASNYRSTYSSEHLGTTPISMASLQKQVNTKGDSEVVKDPFEPDFDTPETPVKSSPSKSLLGRRSSPVIRRGGSPATAAESTKTTTSSTSSSLNSSVPATASTPGSGSATSSVTTAASPSSSTPGTSATPPTFFPSSSSGGDGAEPLLNGPISNISAPPKPAGMLKGSGSNGLGSPVKGNTECAGGTGASCSMPTSMEQLLERQWEQGSAFLIEQGQHFDIASLLNCLHQLRQENQRLEEHITALTARRDHLLAVNARLSIPLSTPNTPHNSTAGPSQGTSSETGSSHQRSPRINNYLPPDNIADLGKNTGRSPAHSQSPAQNHLSAASSANQSPAGSLNTSLSSQTQSPDGRGGSATAVTSSPSSSTSQTAPGSMLTDAQRHQILMHHQQQQLAAMGHNLTQEQQQTLMYQMMQQQQAERAAAASHQTNREAGHRDNPATSTSGATVPTSRSQQQQQKHGTVPTSGTSSNNKPREAQDKMKGKS